MIDIALYRRVLSSQPRLRRMILWGAVARLPIGMNSLAITLATQSLTGSYASAGAVAACFLVASALSAPFVGRWIDQRGPRGVLTALAFVYVSAMVSMFALPAATPLSVFAVVAALAGATMPPVGTLSRAMWAKSSLSHDDKRAGFSIEGMITEIAFMVGPLLVSTALALGAPRTGTLLSAGICAVGIFGFISAGGVSAWGHVERNVARHWSGPLQFPAFRLLLVLAFFNCLALGMNEMVFVAYTKSNGIAAWVGALYFVACLTSAIGTLWFGGRAFALPLPLMLALFAVYTAVTFAAMMLAPNFGVMLVVAAASGAFVGAIIAGIYALAASLVPNRYATETGTWVSCMLMIGIGAGFALAGVLVEQSNWQTLAWQSAVPMLAVAALGWKMK